MLGHTSDGLSRSASIAHERSSKTITLWREFVKQGRYHAIEAQSTESRHTNCAELVARYRERLMIQKLKWSISSLRTKALFNSVKPLGLELLRSS